METKESKSVLDLRKKMVATQTHINRIYTIISALYEEIQEVKRHTNYKPVEATPQMALSTQSQQSQQGHHPAQNQGNGELGGQKAYGKLKIINN